MVKDELIERAKMYIRLLSNGISPISGIDISSDSELMNPKLQSCFSFIIQILEEYIVMERKIEELEKEKDQRTVVVLKKENFQITKEQCSKIDLSQEPITVLSFTNHINSVINTETMEKLTSTRVNKWLTEKGLIKGKKVQTIINRTVYSPSEFAQRIGIIEEQAIDKNTGEVTTRLKLGRDAQFFILDNIEDIIATTK